MNKILRDSNNNSCSTEYFGSVQNAQNALDSLENCFRCSNCSDCSGCSNCSDCSDCSGCFRCSNCSNCSDCSGCSGCSDCSNCSDCFNCFRCPDKKQQEIIVPVISDLHNKLFQAVNIPGHLNMSIVHNCETTHCRAGWVIHLAGKDGYELEKRFGFVLAAMKIYDKNCPGYKINPCRFFDSNEAALEDMKKLASV